MDVLTALSSVLTVEFWFKVAAFIAILIVGWVAGSLIGRAVNRVIDKTLEPAFLKTEVGRMFKEAGVDLSNFIGGLTKAFVIVIALIAALEYVGLTALAGGIIKDIAYYLPKLLGGIFAVTVGLILSALLADYLGNIVTKMLPEVGTLLRNLLLVGLVALVVSIGLQLMLPPNVDGSLVYPLILGFAVIGLGLVVGETIGKVTTTELAPYAKFVIALLFVVVGIGAIFANYPGITAIVEKLAWGVAIALGVALIPAVAKMIKQALS